ncbi:hypothetical protein [Kitasatospora sp. NPDC001095]
MPEVARPQAEYQLHQVVLDLTRTENNQPREFVFVGLEFGRAVLRPLGYSAPEHRVDLESVRPVIPIEIAAGTAGRSHRHRIDGISA